MSDPSILPDHWEVPLDFHARMGAQAGRQRAMTSDGHLLLILHAVPDPNDVRREARFFWRDPAANWDSSDLGQGRDALVKHLDQYEQALAELDQSEQSAKSADMYFVVMEKLTPLRHAVGNLHEPATVITSPTLTNPAVAEYFPSFAAHSPSVCSVVGGYLFLSKFYRVRVY